MFKFNADEFMKQVKKDFKDIVEDREIELSCDCGHKIKERVGRLKKDPKLYCPVCKSTLSTDSKGLRDILKSLGE